jgi:hypothetical protein
MGLIPADVTEANQLHRFENDELQVFPITSMIRSVDEDSPDKPSADCFLLYGLRTLMIRETATEALNEVLRSCGEFYPCATTEGRYFAFKVTQVIDALDYERSDIKFGYSGKAKTKRPRLVHQYCFKVERLNSAPIFMLPEFPVTNVYVTDTFRDHFIKAGLTGLLFDKLFPTPSAEQARIEAQEQHRAKRARKMKKHSAAN